MNQKAEELSDSKKERPSITSAELQTALGVFEKLHQGSTVLHCGIEELNHFYMHCCKEFGKRKQSNIARRYFKKSERKQFKEKLKQKKNEALMRTHKVHEKQMVKLQVHSNFHLTEEQKEHPFSPRTSATRCYVCKNHFKETHFFYSELCGKCGDFSYNKRLQKVDLKDKVAIVTGARVKIGFEIALILLRNGAQVVATSRFPKNTALRFSKVQDFGDWKDRLLVYGLDLKNKDSIFQFCRLIKHRFSRLDILINNAAQTVRKPPAAYTGLISEEKQNLDVSVSNLLLSGHSSLEQLVSQSQELVVRGSDEQENPLANLGDLSSISRSALLSAIPFLEEDFSTKGFDHKCVDVHNELVDLRSSNSWVKFLEEVPVTEFVEVLMVNVIAPFILNQQFQSLMAKQSEEDDPRFIVNVSAMEGVFYARYKSARHPHTNMAKAALNMMTRTCGIDFASNGIYMTSVDTGWVTDEMPMSHENNFIAPLDELDGAMRVVDPVFQGLQGKELLHSVFLKDYQVHSW